MMATCRCRSIHGHRCTTEVRDVDSGGGCACAGTAGIWEISVLSFEFYYEPKSALKKLTLNKKKIQFWFFLTTSISLLKLYSFSFVSSIFVIAHKTFL